MSSIKKMCSDCLKMLRKLVGQEQPLDKKIIVCMSCCRCVDELHARGICEKCYNRLKMRVHRKTTTWEQLEKEGECRNARKYTHTRRV